MERDYEFKMRKYYVYYFIFSVSLMSDASEQQVGLQSLQETTFNLLNSFVMPKDRGATKSASNLHLDCACMNTEICE